MKLAEFLAEHVREERRVQGSHFCLDAELIQTGIEAFAKAEDVVITVCANADVLEIY